jgi:trimethylamine--corrinoid protein Co-methyltransferase
MLWAAEKHIPVICIGGPTVGIESPVTGASALVIYLATALSALAIVQLKYPGAPMLIGGIPAAMDLRNARPAYGSPEMSLYSAAAAELAQYLGIPFMGTGGVSESKLVDSQAAIEASLQILISGLSSASLVHDIGFLDCADIGSLEYLVLIDEIIAMVKRLMRGIEVNPDTIMLDLIEKVGPGGHFLEEPRSASICRQEIWVPKLMDRDAYVFWEAKGSKSMEERVRERLDDILKDHKPTPLDREASQKIKLILSRAENRYT